MRAFKTDAAPEPGWSVDWKIDDYYKYVGSDRDIHVRYTDLTDSAEASICEAWVDTAIYGETSHWIPRVMVRRKAVSSPLESTFLSVVEPYESASKISAIRRLPLNGPAIGIEVARVDGKTDVVLLRAGAATPIVLPERELTADAELVYLTIGANGIEAARAVNAKRISIGSLILEPERDGQSIEWRKES
jgi:hypothetical protein